MPVYSWRAVRVATEDIGPNEGLAGTEIEAMELAETAMESPAASIAVVQPLELRGETLKACAPAIIGVRTLSGEIRWYNPEHNSWMTTAEHRDKPPDRWLNSVPKGVEV